MFGKPRSGYYTLPSNQRQDFKVIMDPEVMSKVASAQPSVRETWTVMFKVLSNIKRHGCREVWPSLAAGQVCENTRVLENMSINEVMGVLPSFIINVPTGLTESPRLGHLTHVLCDFTCKCSFPQGLPLTMLARARSLTLPTLVMIFSGQPDYVKILQFYSGETISDVMGVLKTSEQFADGTIEDAHVAGSWALNIALLMKSYPTFLTKHPAKVKPAAVAIQTVEYHLHLGKEIKFEEPKAYVDHRGHHPEVIGRHMPQHWRVGHWRRQVHGEGWCGSAVKMGTFEDGRPYHLVLIPPVFVNAKEQEFSEKDLQK